MRGFADLVARRWQEPDAGIWEIRADAAHHVHSKLMGWLALDRALRIARHPPRQRPAAAPVAEPSEKRSPPRSGPGASTLPGTRYTRSYGSGRPRRRTADPARIGFETPDSPRLRGTVDAVRRELSAGCPVPLPLPARPGRAARHRGRLPALLVLARPGPRPTGRAAEATDCSTALLAIASPLGPLQRGDRPRHRCPPRQLPPGPDPRRAGPGGPGPPRRRNDWKVGCRLTIGQRRPSRQNGTALKDTDRLTLLGRGTLPTTPDTTGDEEAS